MWREENNNVAIFRYMTWEGSPACFTNKWESSKTRQHKDFSPSILEEWSYIFFWIVMTHFIWTWTICKYCILFVKPQFEQSISYQILCFMSFHCTREILSDRTHSRWSNYISLSYYPLKWRFLWNPHVGPFRFFKLLVLLLKLILLITYLINVLFLPLERSWIIIIIIFNHPWIRTLRYQSVLFVRAHILTWKRCQCKLFGVFLNYNLV